MTAERLRLARAALRLLREEAKARQHDRCLAAAVRLCALLLAELTPRQSRKA